MAAMSYCKSLTYQCKQVNKYFDDNCCIKVNTKMLSAMNNDNHYNCINTCNFSTYETEPHKKQYRIINKRKIKKLTLKKTQYTRLIYYQIIKYTLYIEYIDGSEFFNNLKKT